MFIRSMLCVFALTAVSSAQSTTPMLDTGIPNLFFPPPGANHGREQHRSPARLRSPRNNPIHLATVRHVQPAVRPHVAV